MTRDKLPFPIVVTLVLIDAVGEVVSELRGVDLHLARSIVWGIGSLVLLWSYHRRPPLDPSTRVLYRWAVIFAVLMCAHGTARAAGLDPQVVEWGSVIVAVIALVGAFAEWRRAYKATGPARLRHHR